MQTILWSTQCGQHKQPDTALILAKLKESHAKLSSTCELSHPGESTLSITGTLHINKTTMPNAQLAFGKTGHNSVLLIPESKRKFRWAPPVRIEVKRWSDQSKATLQSTLDDVDWEVFKTN